jgi:ribulose-phosphate 3-epimerase
MTGSPTRHPIVIAPSLLAANFGHLRRESERISRSGAEWMHLDIMDGHFVPNLSFGVEVVKVLRPHSSLHFDVHLMCSKPDILLEPFSDSGADSITIHVELGRRVEDLIWQIRSMKKKVGLSINPPTSFHDVEPFLDQIDQLLIMTVNPGFGGQRFIEETLPKIQQAYQWRTRNQLQYRIQVDGGIDDKTGPACASEGADTFVSGSHLFKQHNMRQAVRKLRHACHEAAEGYESRPKKQKLKDQNRSAQQQLL